jgi:predicted flap endonuclease-1-like 5' DNA nuclease
MATIADIEGIGPVFAEKLAAAGVNTVEGLLEQAGAKAGRVSLAAATGIDEGSILTWVNHADLYRISGIGSEFSQLLEATGVDTVPELATRNADNLYAALQAKNEESHLVRQLPSAAQVADFIAQAGSLDRMVSH